VGTKAALTDPSTLDSTVNYLCRVINYADTPANNGVWQLIAGAEEWAYFSDNLDFVDRLELDAAVEAAVTVEEAARKAADGGSGEGAVCEVRTAYAPGDVQKDGSLQYVPYSDPIVQMTRLRGFTKDYLETSEVARRTVLSEAMRRWSPSFLYVEGDITNFEGAWYTPNPEDIPIFGESPDTNPEKWSRVGGGSGSGGGSSGEVDDVRVNRIEQRVDTLWSEVFGGGMGNFTSNFALDFFTLAGVNLEEGIWRDTLGRVEV
jgi:hypothetical protein